MRAILWRKEGGHLSTPPAAGFLCPVDLPRFPSGGFERGSRANSPPFSFARPGLGGTDSRGGEWEWGGSSGAPPP